MSKASISPNIASVKIPAYTVDKFADYLKGQFAPYIG